MLHIKVYTYVKHIMAVNYRFGSRYHKLKINFKKPNETKILHYGFLQFSAVRYERLVQPKQEATFDYAFIPSDAFVGRPLGLVVNLHYVDTVWFSKCEKNEKLTCKLINKSNRMVNIM